MSHQKNVGQNHSIKKANKSFGNEAKFKYLGMTLTYKTDRMRNESRLNLGNNCYPFI